jgi:hypothetical protein
MRVTNSPKTPNVQSVGAQNQARMLPTKGPHSPRSSLNRAFPENEEYTYVNAALPRVATPKPAWNVTIQRRLQSLKQDSQTVRIDEGMPIDGRTEQSSNNDRRSGIRHSEALGKNRSRVWKLCELMTE